MSKWLVVAVVCYVRIPEVIKDIVEDARDTATALGVDRLGLAEIVDGEETYYVIRKDDFEEWFGD